MSDDSTTDAPQGHPRPGIACPSCHAHPIAGMLWVCGPDGCGAAFDTFASRGKCPRCEAQFTWTQCLSCGRVSAHGAFYLKH